MKLKLQNWGIHNTLSIDIDNNTAITGNQGTGKTSILTAIIFVLYGKDFYGAIGIDRYIQKGKSDTTVMLVLDDIEIKRVLTTKGSELYINGAKSSQSELNNIIPPIESTLPALNPFYIMGLSDQEKREIFIKLLPSQNRKEVFISMYGEKLADTFEITTPSQVKAQIKNYEAYINNGEAQIEQLTFTIKESDTKLKEISTQMAELPPVNTELDTEKIRTNLIKAQREVASLGDIPEKITKYTQELKNISTKIAPILQRHHTKNISDTKAKHQTEIQAIKRYQEELINKIAQLEAQKSLIQGEDGKCIICKSPYVPNENADTELENTIKNETELLTNSKKQLQILLEELGVLESLQGNANMWSNELDKNRSLESAYKKAQEELVFYQLQLDEALKVDMSKNKALEAEKQFHTEQQQNATKRIEEIINQTREIQEQLLDWRVLETALSPKGVDSVIIKTQTEELSKIITQYLPTITIETVKENKTNEGHKEVFNVLLDGIEYKNLGFGKQLIVSTALSLVIRELQPSFKLPFLLLDEASILSTQSLNLILDWCTNKKINLIYTKISDEQFNITNLNGVTTNAVGDRKVTKSKSIRARR